MIHRETWHESISRIHCRTKLNFTPVWVKEVGIEAPHIRKSVKYKVSGGFWPTGMTRCNDPGEI